jgi:hypothetical protein
MKRNNHVMIHTTSLLSPPAKAENVIAQATLGPSHNRCTFCGMYKSKRFCVCPIKELALVYLSCYLDIIQTSTRCFRPMATPFHYQLNISQSCYVY